MSSYVEIVPSNPESWSLTPPGLPNPREREHKERRESLRAHYGTNFEGYLAVATRVNEIIFDEFAANDVRPEMVEQYISYKSYKDAYDWFMDDQGGSEYSQDKLTVQLNFLAGMNVQVIQEGQE